MTLLSLVTAVMDEQGLTAPTVLVGSSDPTAKRLVAIAGTTGEALYRAHDWSVLAREHPFSTEAAVSNYALPDDWGRPVGSTAWDRTSYWRVRGNLTPQQWQSRKSGLLAVPGLRFGYRILSGPLAASILIDPTPASAVDLVIEYVSRWWSQTTGEDGQPALLADTDDIRLDHELFRLGLTWRVKKSFGMSYIDDRADYEAAVGSAIVSDLNLQPVNAAGPDCELPEGNIPDGDWPGPA